MPKRFPCLVRARATFACAALALTLASGRTLPAQDAPPRCASTNAPCVQTRTFDVQVSDVRVTAADYQRLLTLSLRIRNTTDRPLTLGYVYGSAIAIDDQGARYTVTSNDAVRGLGIIAGSRAETKFTLQPGEVSDARIEMTWRNSANQLFGTRWNVDVALREIDPVAGNQIRLGREHALRFTGLTDQAIVVAAADAPPLDAPTPAAPESTPSVASPTSPPTDPCAGQQRCASTAAFVAEVTSVAATTEQQYGPHHLLRYRLRLRNITARPLVLAYTRSSSLSIDEHGQRYESGYGQVDPESRGIGVATASAVDPQFHLEPGQSRDVYFTVSRRIGNSAIGRSFSWDLALQEIQILNGGQLRTLREHAIGFRDLVPSMAGSMAADEASVQQVQEGVKKIGDVIGGLFRKKRP